MSIISDKYIILSYCLEWMNFSWLQPVSVRPTVLKGSKFETSFQFCIDCGFGELAQSKVYYCVVNLNLYITVKVWKLFWNWISITLIEIESLDIAISFPAVLDWDQDKLQ